MKQKALRAGDAQSHEDEECCKRSTLRFGRCLTLALSNVLGARMCRGTIFLNVILHNYDHGKEKMIEERKFNLNLT